MDTQREMNTSFDEYYQAFNEYYQAYKEFDAYKGRIVIHTKEECPECMHVTPKFAPFVNNLRIAKGKQDLALKVEGPYFNCFTRFLGYQKKEQKEQKEQRESVSQELLQVFVFVENGTFVEIPDRFFEVYSFPPEFRQLYKTALENYHSINNFFISK
jgi:hypothetical protein